MVNDVENEAGKRHSQEADAQLSDQERAVGMILNIWVLVGKSQRAGQVDNLPVKRLQGGHSNFCSGEPRHAWVDELRAAGDTDSCMVPSEMLPFRIDSVGTRI